jgi:hypothetical protein
MGRMKSIPEDTNLRLSGVWTSFPKILGGIGLASLVLAFIIGAVGGEHGIERFHFSYLTAYMYGLSFALGGLFFVMVQFLARAGWSVVVRRVAENVMGTLPLFAVLFIPVAVGLHHTHHHWWGVEPGHDHLVDHKAPYLNQPFFFIRVVFYFAVWIFLALTFWRSSTRQDETGDHELTHKMQWWSAPGMLLFALTVTFAAIDWMKSMEPHWFSTMWGVYFFAGCVIAIFSMLSTLIIALQRTGHLQKVINAEHFHDLGKLSFGFVVFWSYIAFSQYFLIWYANIPEETLWFEHRYHHGWETVGALLIVGHFFIPFFFLLPRGIKRNPATLIIGAAWLLFIHYVDIYYIVMPVFSKGPQPGILDLLCLVGVMGLFLATFSALASRSELVPVKDPRLPESLAFHNV